MLVKLEKPYKNHRKGEVLDVSPRVKDDLDHRGFLTPPAVKKPAQKRQRTSRAKKAMKGPSADRMVKDSETK